MPVGFHAEGAARRAAAEPDVWTDGSLVEDKVSGASSAGSGLFFPIAAVIFGQIGGGAMDDDVGEDAVVRDCRGFCSVPGPLQTVQRAEFWGSYPCFAGRLLTLFILGVDNLNVVRHVGRFFTLVFDNLGVVRHVGRLLDGKGTSRTAELVKDVDLTLLVERMLRLRGLDGSYL